MFTQCVPYKWRQWKEDVATFSGSIEGGVHEADIKPSSHVHQPCCPRIIGAEDMHMHTRWICLRWIIGYCYSSRKGIHAQPLSFVSIFLRRPGRQARLLWSSHPSNILASATRPDLTSWALCGGRAATARSGDNIQSC